MKKFLFYIPIILFTIFFETKTINAQIPNGDFESWTNGLPDSFIAYNITQSTDKYSGNFAAKGTVDSLFSQLLAPQLLTLFPISKVPASLTGYYKFTPLGPNEVLTMVVQLFKDSTFSSYLSAGGYEQIGTPATSYNKFTVPIYGDATGATYMDFSMTIEDTSNLENPPVKGSFFIVDDLQLSETATGITEQVSSSPKKFELNQNYPNPFNPSTNISYSIPDQDFVKLDIYNITGELVKNLVDENQTAGTHQVIWDGKNTFGRQVSSGVYFYRIISRKYNSIKKMIMLK
jgi:FlgD Ig-like domain